MPATARTFICVASTAVVLTGCGGSGGGTPATTSATLEHTDRPAALLPGWRRIVNRRSGFSVGLPPGWTARGSQGTTLVRSADRALALGISADRSDGGRSGPLTAYARRIARALPGYRDLRLKALTRLHGAHYPGVRLRASGTYSRTRVRQAIEVIVIRRGTQVTYTLAAFRNARARAVVYSGAIAEMLRSFRAQPPLF